MNSDVIQVPDTKHSPRFSKVKNNCPEIKYMYITKFRIWHRKVKKNDRTKRLTRVNKYGIGVLTTDMKFYYSEFSFRLKELKDQHIELLKRLVTANYIISEQSKISLSDNITRRNDAVGLFMDIVSSALDKKIGHVSPERMINVLNRWYSALPHAKTKDRSLIIKRLKENYRYDFITDRNWKIKYDLMSYSRKMLFDDTMLGILYMNASCAAQHKDRMNKLKRLIKLGIITEESIKEDNYETK